MGDKTAPGPDEVKAEKCDGSRDPRRRCGLHHRTELAWICGGYECCCGDSWLNTQNICSTGADPGAPVSLKDRLDSLISWANTAEEREAAADVVFAALDQRDAEIKRLNDHIDADPIARTRRDLGSVRALDMMRAAGRMEVAAEVEPVMDQLLKRAVKAEDAIETWRADHQLAQDHLGQRLDQRLEATVTVLGLARIATEAIDEAEAERDDYANRLRAVDRSWADLAAERDQLKAAVARVRQLHSRALPSPNCADPGCDYCGDSWPCSTIAALDQPAESKET